MRIATAFLLAAVGTIGAEHVQRLEPQATGTGAITGRVVQAGSDIPVAGAKLRLHQTRGETPAGVYPRSGDFTTDSSGTFSFHNLPAGQFSIQASADGYQPGAIGKRRPQGEEAWITLSEGRTFSNLTIELFRSGTISGQVTNDRGEPMRDVRVQTWRRTGNGQLEGGSFGQTDAAGAYRMNAEPGEHFVLAHVWHNTLIQRPPGSEDSSCAPPPPPGAPPMPIVKPKYEVGEWYATLPRWIPEPDPDARGTPRTIPTTIYPGVTEVPSASAVSILDGEDRTGINLKLSPTVTSIVHGRVVPLPGKTVGKGSEVRLRMREAPKGTSEHLAWVQPDNTFRFLRVPEGSYILELQLQEALSCDVIMRSSEDVLTEMPVDVPPAGLDDLVVPVAAGVAMRGQIRFDGRTPRPQNIDIWLAPTSGGDFKHGSADNDARMTLDGLVAGEYALNVSDDALQPRWFLRSMSLNKLDLVVRPAAIGREDVSGVEVMLTDRPSPLSGQVADRAGRLVQDSTVVVFPVDRATWATAHDRLAGFQYTRSLDGTYRFEHLVPGEYFIAAVDERRMDDWPREAFLAAIARQAARVRVAPGEALTLRLALQVR